MNVHDQIRDMAEAYLNLDLPIIPLCPHNHRAMSDRHKSKCKSPGKSPILKNWTKHLTTTPDEVDQWFERNQYINLGLVLGQTENWNIVGLDIDGQLGEQTFQKVSEGKEVPATWEYETGGGRRLLYLLPDGYPTKKNRITWKEGHEELAFLASGQQTVLPPSIHPSKKQYLWKLHHSPFDMDIAPAPDWIQEMVYAAPEDVNNLYGEAQSAPVVLEECESDVSSGSRSNFMARFVGALCAKRNLPKDTVVSTAMQHNLLHCKPPLDEGEVSAMVDSIWESEQLKHQEMLAKQRKRKELNPIALVNLFIKEQFEQGIRWRYNEERGTLFRTTVFEGPWTVMTDDQVDMYINTFLSEQDPGLAVSSKRAEVKRQLELYLLSHVGKGELLDLGRHPYHDYIALTNGVLDWQNHKLLAWDPNRFNHTTVIQAKWNKEAKDSEAYTVWDDALHSWIDDENTIMFLQEYIGYSLLPSCKMRTATFLYGEGANGKSLFIDIVKVLFEDSIATVQPQSLTSRFGTVDIIDKLLIECTDIDAQYIEKTGVLKQLIAGDSVRAEYKGGKSFGINPVGKMLFSANRLPKASDKSHGWYSRLQFVHFPHQFKPDQKYYSNLVSTMSSDEGRSALLTWALEGLVRLETAGQFTISESMNTSKLQYRMENDNVLAFAETLLEPNPLQEGSYKTSLQLKAVYATYKDWCDETGMRVASQSEFTQRIQSKYTKKSLRWKVGKAWKSQVSLLDVRFQEATDFDGQQVYDLHAALVAAR